MLIYSVYLTLQQEIESEWLEFMQNKHIKDVMTTGCFTDYELIRELNSSEPGKVSFRVDYHVLDIEKMDEYLNDFSAELRNDVVSRFEGKFSAERKIYEVIESFI